MKTYPECIPCQVSFALRTARKAADDDAVVGSLVLRSLELILSFGLDQPPPRVAREIGRLVKAETGVRDPYRDEKERQNQVALELYPHLKRRVERAVDPLREALLLAAGGNVIDSIALGERDPLEALEDLGGAFAKDNYGELRDELEKAKSLLLVGDNAGEIVIDKILVEELLKLWPSLEVLYAVRGGPTINDATMEDAIEVGMTEICRVITTGDDTPGVILELCSDDFRGVFLQADLVLAKGQGNFETLEEVRDPRLFFLLRAKCPTIIRHIGLTEGAPVLLRAAP